MLHTHILREAQTETRCKAVFYALAGKEQDVR